MLRVAPGAQQIVAVLHDVVEDSAGKVTFDDLAREGFSQEVIDGVRAVTRIEGESYEAFIARAALNRLRLCPNLYKPTLGPQPCFLMRIAVHSARGLRRHAIGSWQTMTTIPIATLSVWKGISPRS